ncbi:MAG: hypothetical protein LBR90_05015, partial [Elusimicrobiota bacterium]|nr:hypothetical protein [Elusimicrobiota bacterium]
KHIQTHLLQRLETSLTAPKRPRAAQTPNGWPDISAVEYGDVHLLLCDKYPQFAFYIEAKTPAAKFI